MCAKMSLVETVISARRAPPTSPVWVPLREPEAFRRPSFKLSRARLQNSDEVLRLDLVVERNEMDKTQ